MPSSRSSTAFWRHLADHSQVEKGSLTLTPDVALPLLSPFRGHDHHGHFFRRRSTHTWTHKSIKYAERPPDERRATHGGTDRRLVKLERFIWPNFPPDHPSRRQHARIWGRRCPVPVAALPR